MDEKKITRSTINFADIDRFISNIFNKYFLFCLYIYIFFALTFIMLICKLTPNMI